MGEAGIQSFLSETTEWNTDYTNFSGETLKNVEKNFNTIRKHADAAADAIAHSGLDVSSLNVTVKQADIDKYVEQGDKLEEFTKGIHADVVSLVDDPFYTKAAEAYVEILEISLHGITDGEKNLTHDIKDILNGEQKVFETVEVPEELVLAMEQNLGADVTGEILKLMQSLLNDTGSDRAIIQDVYGYTVKIEKKGGVIRLVDITGSEGKGDYIKRARALMQELSGGEHGSDLTKMEIKKLVGNDGISSTVVSSSALREKYPDLLDYISFKQGNVLDKIDAIKSAAGSTFIESLNPAGNLVNLVDDVKAKNFGRAAGDAVGIAGDVVGVVINMDDNFRDPYGNWNVTPSRVQKVITDSAADLVTGAGSAAAGAAVGTAIGGPVGTVIGFGVGLLIDIAVSVDWDGDGKSISDGLKDDVFDPLADIITFGGTL